MLRIVRSVTPVLAALTLSCGPSAPAAVPPPKSIANRSATERGQSLPRSEYALLMPPPQQERSFDLGDGRVGIVAQNRRMIVDARGSILELIEDELAVRRIEALADKSGFLFFTSTGLGFAPSFGGALKMLVTGEVGDASVGPGFVLARMSSGAVVAVDVATGARRKGLPLGIADVASAGGLSVGLAHGGRTYLSEDGATWLDASSRLSWTPTRLTVQGTAVVVENRELSLAARAQKGGFVPVALPQAQRTKSDLWPHSQGAMQAVMTRGAPFGQDRAVVAEDGSIHVVSLRTGEVLESERGVLPPGHRACESASVGDKVLFFCSSGSGSSPRRATGNRRDRRPHASEGRTEPGAAPSARRSATASRGRSSPSSAGSRRPTGRSCWSRARAAASGTLRAARRARSTKTSSRG